MVHDFRERYEFSRDEEQNRAALNWLLDQTPGSLGFEESRRDEDLKGVDYWVSMKNGKRLGVDLKKRDRPYPGDLCIEVCSVYKGPIGSAKKYSRWFDSGKCESVGWSLDYAKITDVVLFSWAPAVGGQPFYWKADFPTFRKIADEHWKKWANQYGLRAAKNRGYSTLCVFPKVEEVNLLFEQY